MICLPASARVLLLIAAICILPTQLWAVARTGQAAPDFKVTTTAGQAVSLENYRGHVLIVDFFATWCQPCRVSIPHLVELNKKYSKQGLQVLGLSADEDGERQVKSFIDANRISYPVALAGDSVLADFGVRAVPVMVVIDKKGKIAEVYRGYSDDMKRAAEQLIKKLLAER